MFGEWLLQIKSIYESLGDEVSKEIFKNRLLYSLSGDSKYIKNIITTTKEGCEIYNILEDRKRKKVIFGAGIWAHEILNAYKDIEFECMVDNRIVERTVDDTGMPIVSFDEYMKEYRDAIVVIATRLYHKEIYEQLLENGIVEENIINAGKMLDSMSVRQYFDLPELKLSNNEVFIDAGSFDGKTASCFVDLCRKRGIKYKGIWAFEPDSNNRGKCINTLESCGSKKYQVIECGLWHEDTELRFSSGGNAFSKVLNDGDSIVKVRALDNIIKDDDVTFIKMDIEGAEYNALLGAEQIIKKNKPKLAISIYHKPEDICEIPLLIKKMNEEYKFYLRHYSVAEFDTVLYAI